MELITIGMPVFNDIKFIEESIQSILSQSFVNFKLLISDDGATDGSQSICEKYEKLDSRVVYIRQEINLGISKNMQFLLNSSETEFFIWAADDDIWHVDFLQETNNLLVKNPDSIVAFSKYNLIDEKNNTISTISNPNYSSTSSYHRLKNFIKNSDDGFGYGLFRTSQIKKVHFPTWWWPNKNTPYNNIFPTLCFYLAKGNYLEYTEEPLFFKRVKTEKNTNHKLIGQGNAFKETAAYIIRRFNLITFSTKEIRKANSGLLALRIYPIIFYHWFFISSYQQIKLSLKSFIKNRLRN